MERDQTAPSVTVHLSWRRPAEVSWQTRNRERILVFEFDQGHASLPLARRDVWKKFAVQNASEEVIEGLCRAYGYLVMPPRSHSHTVMKFSYWQRELRLLWIAARLCHLLNQPEQYTLKKEGKVILKPEEMRAILKLEDLFRMKALAPFYKLLLYSTAQPPRLKLEEIRSYSPENYELDLSPEEAEQFWKSQDWFNEIDPETGIESELSAFMYSQEKSPDFQQHKQEVEKELTPSIRRTSYKKRADLKLTYQYFEWPLEDVQRGVQEMISSYTKNVSIDLNLAARELRLKPDTLLTGLWIQLSQWAMTGKVAPLRMCEQCGAILLKRQGTRYCSAACKMAARRAQERHVSQEQE